MHANIMHFVELLYDLQGLAHLVIHKSKTLHALVIVAEMCDRLNLASGSVTM